MEHFFLGIETFESLDRPKEWDVRNWQVEIYLSGRCSWQLRELLIGHSLQKGL